MKSRQRQRKTDLIDLRFRSLKYHFSTEIYIQLDKNKTKNWRHKKSMKKPAKIVQLDL